MIGDPFKGHSGYVTSVAFSHDGVFLVSGSWDRTIRVWNAETGVEVCAPLREHTGPVTSVACSPNGIHVVSGSWDHSVRLWNLADILARGNVGQEHSSSESGAIYPKDQDDTIPRLRPDITTQYPPHLFPSQTFDMQDGWILGPNKELLLWVPGINRSNLYTPSSRSHILGVPPTELDFRDFKCGTEWTQCREPINTE